MVVDGDCDDDANDCQSKQDKQHTIFLWLIVSAAKPFQLAFGLWRIYLDDRLFDFVAKFLRSGFRPHANISFDHKFGVANIADDLQTRIIHEHGLVCVHDDVVQICCG